MSFVLGDPRGVLDVVTMGEALAVLVAGDGLPLASAQHFRRTVAGAEANVAVALARLGHRVAFATRVGGDPLGEAVLRSLRGEGFDVTATVDPDRGTGILVRDAFAGPGGGDVCYGRNGSAGSALSTADVPRQAWDAARILHVTGITAVLSAAAHDAVVETARALRSSGATICLDPNLRRRLTSPGQLAVALQPLAGLVDIVVGSPEEICIFGQEPDVSAATERLLDTGVRLIAVKDGAAGSWATDGTNSWQQPALPTVVADPVGAGDAYVAGLLSGLLDGLEPQPALFRAATVAAACVAAVGDIEGLPTRRQVLAAGHPPDVRR